MAKPPPPHRSERRNRDALIGFRLTVHHNLVTIYRVHTENRLNTKCQPLAAHRLIGFVKTLTIFSYKSMVETSCHFCLHLNAHTCAITDGQN